MHESVHDDIPVDAFCIPDLYHRFLMEKQTEGYNIVADSFGFPIFAEPEEEEEDIDSLSSQARMQRNRLLAETDWTQMPDISDKVRSSYAEYRQALRDIPQQDNFPLNIEWPKKP